MNKNQTIVAFEGLDGCGKGTQVNNVYERLISDGFSCKILDFPVYDGIFGFEIGKMLSGKNDITINNLDPKSIALWFTLDRYNAFNACEDELHNYDFLLLNRSTLSNMIYQAARVNKEDKEELMDWIYNIEHTTLNIPIPDIYLYFHINFDLISNNILNKKDRKYIKDSTKDLNESNNILLKNVFDIYNDFSTQEIHNIKLNTIFCSEGGTMIDKDIITDEVINIIMKESQTKWQK